jgi:thiol-disulfide isomerase/thioredoxin
MRVAATAFVLLAGACTSSSGGSNGNGATPSGRPAVNATTAPLLPTTAFALPSVTPERFAALLSQLRGTPVVLNVWGSWCGPCREEGPRLAAAGRRYGRRVQFLGLDVKDEAGPARTFIRSEGWTYPSVFDPTPNAAVELQLGYFAQPVTVFYAADGRKVDVVSGPVSSSDLSTGIRRILS